MLGTGYFLAEDWKIIVIYMFLFDVWIVVWNKLDWLVWIYCVDEIGIFLLLLFNVP
jgi:hypothetical protein